MMAVFQSTPPVKAATRKAEGNTVPSLISIHAAREGGDVVFSVFQSTVFISIHAARECGDKMPEVRNFVIWISIHAAREGGDCGTDAQGAKR